MKVCLFVAVALLTLASSEAVRGITIPISLFEWERPDCEAITNGGYPPEKCLCGQSHIIRNLSAEEAEIDRL